MSQTESGFRPAVLVVEDEAVSRLSAMDIVEGTGCEAIGAANADEALRVLESRTDIRAVFTDVQMPGSMDGLDLIRLIKNRWPAMGRLVTSGRTVLAPATLPCGTEFFLKPYLPR